MPPYYALKSLRNSEIYDNLADAQKWLGLHAEGHSMKCDTLDEAKEYLSECDFDTYTVETMYARGFCVEDQNCGGVGVFCDCKGFQPVCQRFTKDNLTPVFADCWAFKTALEHILSEKNTSVKYRIYVAATVVRALETASEDAKKSWWKRRTTRQELKEVVKECKKLVKRVNEFYKQHFVGYLIVKALTIETGSWGSEDARNMARRAAYGIPKQ